MAETKNNPNSTQVNELSLLTFTNLQSAYLIKNLLDANGIFCYITNENTETLAPHYNQMGVSMQIIINKVELEKAISILVENGEKPLLELEGWRFCKKCNSTDLTSLNANQSVFMQLLHGLFLGNKSNEQLKCNSCGLQFVYP